MRSVGGRQVRGGEIGVERRVQVGQQQPSVEISQAMTAVVGAEWRRPTPGRVSQHDGYRHRDLDTRVGTIDVAIPKLRKGTYFPEGCSSGVSVRSPR